jgi:hypothetical protein
MRVFDFYPWITTRDDVADGIIADWEKNGVDVIVQMDWPDNNWMPDARGERIERYVAEHFAEQGRFGRYRLLHRKQAEGAVGRI